MSARRWRFRGLLPLVALVGAALSAQAASAQTLRGRLLETGTDQPIAYGTILLLTEQGDTVAFTSTRKSGLFLLSGGADTVGVYQVSAGALGYQETTDGLFRFEPDDTLDVEFRLLPAPLALDSVIVEARSRGAVVEDGELIRNGFLDRMRSGFGQHVTPAELERLGAVDMEQVFLWTPGVGVSPTATGSRITMRGRGRECTPTVYVNGLRSYTDGTIESLGLDPGAVKAIEVYRSAGEAPLQYGGSVMASCGVLLLWTQ